MALTLLGLMVAMDFIIPSGSWYADHPMTSAAIATFLGFVTAGLLLEGWVKEREAARLRRVSTVAYRSLAQYANDAGRTLLATLNGADLWLLGIPGASPEQVAEVRNRLGRHGYAPTFNEATGSWRRDTNRELDQVLAEMLGDRDYLTDLFRRTAAVRRRMQEVTALWAPVMLTSAKYADDLGRLRDLTDSLELLQELLRKQLAVSASTDPDVSAHTSWIHDTRVQFWHTIDCYETLRDTFGDLAELPSDVIVVRRAGRHALPSDVNPASNRVSRKPEPTSAKA